MNVLQPNAIPKYTTSGGDFKFRENISFFREYCIVLLFYNKIKIENAARAYGLTDAELFQTIDLFEKRNIPQVTHCIYALGRHVSDRFVEVIIHSSLFSYLGTEKEIQRSNTWP
jgi:hypothetical protein